MADYKPQTLYQRLLCALEPLDNRVGYSARRKLMRRYKPRAQQDFQKALRGVGPGDICLDMGANVGDFTTILAQTGAEVHAYEPDPDTFERLKAATGHLENVHLHQAAVGAQAGTMRLRRAREYADDPLRHSVSSSIEFVDDRLAADIGVDVEVLDFYDVLAGFGRPVRLIKMDIEGAELGILRRLQADTDLSGFDMLFAETHQHLRPSDMPEIFQMRAWAAGLSRPEINLYWR